MAFPLLPALGVALAGLVGYKVFGPKPRFVGDVAKAGPLASADQVEVFVPALLQSNRSISQGMGSGQIPPGTATVLVSVLGADKDFLQGPIIAFGSVPTPTPLGSVTVNRKDVQAVIRGGKVLRSPTGQFAGERAKRFMG